MVYWKAFSCLTVSQTLLSTGFRVCAKIYDIFLWVSYPVLRVPSRLPLKSSSWGWLRSRPSYLVLKLLSNERLLRIARYLAHVVAFSAFSYVYWGVTCAVSRRRGAWKCVWLLWTCVMMVLLGWWLYRRLMLESSQFGVTSWIRLMWTLLLKLYVLYVHWSCVRVGTLIHNV